MTSIPPTINKKRPFREGRALALAAVVALLLSAGYCLFIIVDWKADRTEGALYSLLFLVKYGAVPIAAYSLVAGLLAEWIATRAGRPLPFLRAVGLSLILPAIGLGGFLWYLSGQDARIAKANAQAQLSETVRARTQAEWLAPIDGMKPGNVASTLHGVLAGSPPGGVKAGVFEYGDQVMLIGRTAGRLFQFTEPVTASDRDALMKLVPQLKGNAPLPAPDYANLDAAIAWAIYRFDLDGAIRHCGDDRFCKRAFTVELADNCVSRFTQLRLQCERELTPQQVRALRPYIKTDAAQSDEPWGERLELLASRIEANARQARP